VIHRNQLIRKADQDGLSARIVERDYVLVHTLSAISKRDARGQVVFKGGTALRLCHFEDYRYSADLDFSLVNGLSIDDSLDLANDEHVECTTILPIAKRYEDQGSQQCLVYTLEEIAAEKLRCVLQRQQCRDLYDLHELLVTHGVDAQLLWPAFERKARHRERDPADFAKRFESLAPEWKRLWAGELGDYVNSPPPFDSVLRAVRRELRFALR
jgi:predicted nucleotidyltransferase component of viral defense system